MLNAVQVMQLQELLSAARAEVQIRGANIQILEENLAARRRRDVALTIADDEGQTVRFMDNASNMMKQYIHFSQVMESMRRQVEHLTLENERLQRALKDSLSSADSTSGANRNFDEDGDGMERVAQLSTLTLDAQRPSSESSHIPRKAQQTSSLPHRTAMPTVQAAPLLHFAPGSVLPAHDKYSNDFDFSLKPQQQPPIPPPLPIYNGEILQAPYSTSMQKQSSVKDQVKSSTADALPLQSFSSNSHTASVVRAANQEAPMPAPSAAIQASYSSAASALSMQKPSLTAATVVPSISVGVVKSAQASRPPSAGDRASDRSQNSERSAFSASEANEG